MIIENMGCNLVPVISNEDMDNGAWGNFANDQLAVVLLTGAKSRSHTVLLPPGTANHSELTRSVASLKKLEEEFLKPVEDLVHEGVTPTEMIVAIWGKVDIINWITQATMNNFKYCIESGPSCARME